MIWSEERSHSTHEEAVYSAEVLKQKGIHRIVLVTEAYHMLRAEGIAACGYRAFDARTYRHELLSNWESIAWNEDGLHEAAGLIWYGIRGWIRLKKPTILLPLPWSHRKCDWKPTLAGLALLPRHSDSLLLLLGRKLDVLADSPQIELLESLGTFRLAIQQE